MNSAVGYALLTFAIATTPALMMIIFGSLPEKFSQRLKHRKQVFMYACVAVFIAEGLLYRWLCF